MLLTLLKTIQSHPLADMDEIARELNIPVKLLEEMILNLTRKGYLRSLKDCDSTCDHCPMGEACAGNVRPSVWMLTEKGSSAVEN
jgi:DNA-binding IscR family transcriptional regulator